MFFILCSHIVLYPIQLWWCIFGLVLSLTYKLMMVEMKVCLLLQYYSRWFSVLNIISCSHMYKYCRSISTLTLYIQGKTVFPNPSWKYIIFLRQTFVKTTKSIYLEKNENQHYCTGIQNWHCYLLYFEYHNTSLSCGLLNVGRYT